MTDPTAGRRAWQGPRHAATPATDSACRHVAGVQMGDLRARRMATLLPAFFAFRGINYADLDSRDVGRGSGRSRRGIGP